VTLGALALAFGLRVLGQALVAVDQASFLPPMEEWYSGLIPYSALLPMQIAILAVQATVSRDIWRGSGTFAGSRPAVARGLEWLSYAYFALMVLRYIQFFFIACSLRTCSRSRVLHVAPSPIDTRMTEPDVTLTDYGLFVECAAFVWLIARLPARLEALRRSLPTSHSSLELRSPHGCGFEMMGPFFPA
jgi:hypothetical protein